MTKEELFEKASNLSENDKVQLVEKLLCGSDIQTDNHGQLIVYTGVFLQADGTESNMPDPNWVEDD